MNTRDNHFRLSEPDTRVAQADVAAACVALREQFSCTDEQARAALEAMDFQPKWGTE